MNVEAGELCLRELCLRGSTIWAAPRGRESRGPVAVLPSVRPSGRTGPEAGACWACPMNSKVARVTGVLSKGQSGGR